MRIIAQEVENAECGVRSIAQEVENEEYDVIVITQPRPKRPGAES